MALRKIRLGDVVIPYKKKCGNPNLTHYQVSGINKEKEFFEPSNQVGSDTSNYKEVPPGYFACNLMHVGRDVVLPIAYNHTDKIKNVSPAYMIFTLEEDCELHKEYLFMYLKSEEKDRLFWFQTDASIRDGMSWDDFCNIEIEVPDLHVQEKYVQVYQSMIENQKAYEKGLDDLKLVCDAYIEDLRRKMPCEEIGPYIQEQKNKNIDKAIVINKAVSTEKIFIDSHADLNGVDISNYLICRNGQFAYNTVTTKNGNKLSVACNKDVDCLVSPIYTVFEVMSGKIDCAYLLMWFKRSEFDRYARFHSWGSAREMFTFDEMKKVKIPLPDISIQQSIASIYKCYIERKEINEKLKQQIKNICPILIKGSIEEGV